MKVEMKKSRFKSVSVSIFTLVILLLTPIIPSQLAQALASANYQYIVTSNSQFGNTVTNKDANYNSMITATGNINVWNSTLEKIIASKNRYAKWIVVIPAKPTGVTAASASYNSVDISWSGVSGATGYEIYRATASAGTYTSIGTTTATTYKNIGLTANTTYYYKVKAYRMASNAKVHSGYSTIISAKTLTNIISQPSIYTYGNTSGNLTNGASVVSDGQYIYYRNSSDGYKLYKSKPDGSLKSKISDTRCGSLNIIGDSIYYTGSYGNEGIYKMKKDGSGKTLIVNSQVVGIAVVNDWIYYLERDPSQSQKNDLYKIKFDGTGKTKINFGSGSSLVCADLQNIVVVENWVYLSLYNKLENKEQLFRIKTDGTTAQKVLNIKTRFFSIEGGWIYYSDETYKKVYKTKVDGTSTTVLYTIPDSIYSLYSVNVSNGYVYFSNYTESKPTEKFGIYKMKTDGSSLVQLLNGSARFLNVAADWIYFEAPGGSVPTYSNGVFEVIIGGSYQTLKLKTDGSQLFLAN